ncbi:MAG: serine hydrolase domain-containing protein [Gemmatimonadaceae bacterium]
MRRTLLLSLFALPLTAGAQSASPALSPDTVAAIDRVFARYSIRTPGCAVGAARNGQELLVRGYGMADLESGAPVRPGTIFEAGSVSKQVTAFLVLRLEQEGKLSIDDPLRKYLPEVPDYGAPLTIRQVMSHTSGLRDWYSIAEVEGLIAYEHHFRNDDLLEMAARQRALNFPSGSEFLYSNTGWNLLALVVERVSGQSFQDYSRTRLFEPLGMTQTRWRDDFRTVVRGRAPAYARTRDSGYVHQMPLMSIVGAGGLLTTAHDLLLWNENLTSGRVGGRALVERMQQRSHLANGKEIPYGLGLFVRQARGTLEVSHGGATGGYRAHVLRYPERGLSIALLCNDADANSAALANGVADVFLGAAVAQQAGALAASDADAMRGLYRMERTGEPVDLSLRDARPVFAGYTLQPAARDGDTVTALLGINADADTVRLERMQRWSPAAADLRPYVGSYRSDEAPATWRVVANGDTLQLEGPARRRIVLRPAFRDTFTARGLGSVAFRRDWRGQVRAVSFLMGRLRDIQLDRQ